MVGFFPEEGQKVVFNHQKRGLDLAASYTKGQELFHPGKNNVFVSIMIITKVTA
jgi:hypothetical protein